MAAPSGLFKTRVKDRFAIFSQPAGCLSRKGLTAPVLCSLSKERTPRPLEAFSELRAWAPTRSGRQLRVLKSLPSPPSGCYHEVKSERLAPGEEGGAGTLHRRACAQVTVPPDMGARQLSKGQPQCQRLLPPRRSIGVRSNYVQEKVNSEAKGSDFPGRSHLSPLFLFALSASFGLSARN